jgi:Bax protein
MKIFLKKLKIYNSTIYCTGYVFYGLTILSILVAIIISINTKINITNNNYVNVEIDQKEELNRETVTQNSSKNINYNLVNELNSKIEAINFSTLDLKKIFENHAYVIDNVRDQKQVPDITITKFPKDFNLISSTEDKKSLFIKSLLPLIIKENNKITHINRNIKRIQNNKFEYISKSDALWLKRQYLNYKVDSHNINDLLIKVDVIPVSIALAQAAIESGWGTSRFVIEGNALFGQWSWYKGSGIVPEKRDREKTYEIKSFDNLGDSVASYMKNLNSNINYEEFRMVRNSFRKNKSSINSIELIRFLSNYAENTEYSKILKKIIIKNNLKDFDQATIYSLPYEIANLILLNSKLVTKP